MSFRQRLPMWLLIGYSVALALVAFWPVPVDQPFGARLQLVLDQLYGIGATWLDYDVVEFSANVVIFVPLGVLVAAMLPRDRWWQVIVVGAVASTCMEIGQLVFLSGRHPSLTDVVDNTFGALLGALLVLVVRVSAARTGASRSALRADDRTVRSTT